MIGAWIVSPEFSGILGSIGIKKHAMEEGTGGNLSFFPEFLKRKKRKKNCYILGH